MRSWRERWDPDAEFVYNKRLKLGLDPENPWVQPGDPVDKLAIGIRRLHRWWDAGMIRLDKERDNAPKPTIVRLTEKCFEVRVPGKKIIRVGNKQEADSLLRMMTDQIGQTDKSQPYVEKLNKLMWAVHSKHGVEKIKGMNQAIERLHEVARD